MCMRRQQQVTLGAAFWGILNSSNTKRLRQTVHPLSRPFHLLPQPAHYGQYILMTQISTDLPTEPSTTSSSHLEQFFCQHLFQGKGEKNGIQPVYLPNCLTKSKWWAEPPRWSCYGCKAIFLAVLL